MKSYYKLILAAVLIVPVVLISTVSAEDTNTGTNTTTTEQQTVTETETKPELTDQQKAELKKRLDTRKAELKTKLNAAEKLRLTNRCKNSNGPIKSLSGRIKGIETSRTEKYSNLTDRLSKLVEKLKAKNVDTAEFEAELDVLDQKIATFKTDLAAYKQAVTDLEAMNCNDDVDAFKASVDAARTAHDKLKTDGTDIKTYVKETIKPTLKQLRDKVEATENAEEETN